MQSQIDILGIEKVQKILSKNILVCDLCNKEYAKDSKCDCTKFYKNHYKRWDINANKKLMECVVSGDYTSLNRSQGALERQLGKLIIKSRSKEIADILNKLNVP